MGKLMRGAVVAGGMAVVISLASCAAPGVPAAPAPAAPVAAVGAPVPGVAVAAPAEPQGFLTKCCAQIDACRRKLCLTPAGQMLNSLTQPLTFATGGIIPPFCPIVPSAADLAKPGVGGAADAIKKDALEAKVRREKVRFLGTVDCRYYPDAIGALTAALRTDGSECVRYEAALSLSRGCCCNQKTIDALEASVSGTDRDGNPAERSVRVRCTAAIALERCLACYVPPPAETDVVEPVEPKPVEPLPLPVEKKPGDGMTAKKPDTAKSDTAKKGNPDLRLPSKESVERAWQTLNDFNALLAAEAPMAAIHRGDRASVYQIIRSAIDAPESVMTVGAQTAASAPMATDPGTPVFQAPTTQPGRSTLGQPKVELGPVAPVEPIVGQPPLSPVSRPPAEMPMTPKTPAALPTSLAPQHRAGEARVASPAPATGATPLAPMINQLLRGASPSERLAAAREIAGHDWQKNPAVPSMLILGAKNDTSPLVRVECIRQIAAGQMNHPQVLSELETLAKDSDSAVSAEAAKALGQLKP
jgi:hypothetical protein